MSSRDSKICFATCWLFTLLTAFMIAHVVFTAVTFLSIRQLQNNVKSIEGHIAAASEMNQGITDVMVQENEGDREKRSASSPSSSSRLATVDVGLIFASAIKNMCKPEGAICIQGAKGEAGQSGRDGLPGRDGIGLPGRDGLPGSTGATGRGCPVGLRGPPGKPGAKGMGLPGKQGPIGIPGVQGDKGDRGEKGVKGHIGGQGIQGVKGIEGEKGERGDRGERGYTGYKGERGERGMTGEKGMRGEKGNKGIQGEKGEKGKLELPSQCDNANHRVLSDTWRKVSSTREKFGIHRDRIGQNGFQQPGWHVFAASIGGQMPQTCPPILHCGTSAPGWLKGSHPTAVGQTSKETVCFHWDNNCCHWQATVDITNCGVFYVYNLPNEPCDCNLAYCSQG